MVVIVVAIIGVLLLLLLLLASIGKSFSLFVELQKANAKKSAFDEQAAYWHSECERIIEQRDEYREENHRLKKAASKLVVQVAQDFGKEVTNPKKG